MTYIAVGITAIFVIAAFVIGISVVAKVVLGVQQSASETVVATVSESMKTIFGGNEPADQLPGNVEPTETPEVYAPAHEFDDLMFPDYGDVLRDREGGWVRSKTEPPSDVV